MKKVSVVAAVIYNDKNEILITQRVDGQFNGLWEFPGGKIESNETHKEALIREIKEELNIDINVGDFITTVNYNYPTFELEMYVYKCFIFNGLINLNVHSSYKWISKTELNFIKWVPADIEIIDKLMNNW